jgi:hypothetical protein
MQRSSDSPLSSSGLTGRSSTPRPIGSIIDVSGILDRPPQCAIAHKADDDNRISPHVRDDGQRPSIGTDVFVENAKKFGIYCGKNPTMSIVNAAEAVLGK